jgi:hypothetical protein
MQSSELASPWLAETNRNMTAPVSLHGREGFRRSAPFRHFPALGPCQAIVLDTLVMQHWAL